MPSSTSSSSSSSLHTNQDIDVLVPDTHSTSFMGKEGNDFALAYAGGLEYELSLLALSQAVNIRPDKLSGMLWVMQCKGVSEEVEGCGDGEIEKEIGGGSVLLYPFYV